MSEVQLLNLFVFFLRLAMTHEIRNVCIFRRGRAGQGRAGERAYVFVCDAREIDELTRWIILCFGRLSFAPLVSSLHSISQLNCFCVRSIRPSAPGMIVLERALSYIKWALGTLNSLARLP